MPLRPLGTSEIRISPLGLGCWQFSEGRGVVGGYWPALADDVVLDIVRASLATGINWFDTAEAYGGGRSEAALSRALQAAGVNPGDVVVATKWLPFLRGSGSITRTIDERLSHLAPYPIDLHQIHQPMGALSGLRAQMVAMSELVSGGKIRTIGISNFGADQTRRCHAHLVERGHAVASNQVRYNLLDRRIESNGTLAAAKELGITIIAYSPLAQGLLSGKYHDDPGRISKKPGPRRWMPSFRRRGLARSKPVVDLLREISGRYDATPAQVALNWLVSFHGDTVVAIPGASSAAQARANAAALAFELEEKELRALDEVSRPFLR